MLFRNLKGLQIILQCSSITRQEKRGLIIKGIIENCINSYKTIIKLPFLLLGILFTSIYYLLNLLSELFDLIQNVFMNICLNIEDNLPDVTITKGKARDKVLQEIRNKH